MRRRGWSCEVCVDGIRLDTFKYLECVLDESFTDEAECNRKVVCEVHVDGIRLGHALTFKYLGCVLDESGTDRAK